MNDQQTGKATINPGAPALTFPTQVRDKMEC